MGFPPGLWFGEEEAVDDGALPTAIPAGHRDSTVRAILDEVLSMDRRDKELLLGVARGISSSPKKGGQDPAP